MANLVEEAKKQINALLAAAQSKAAAAGEHGEEAVRRATDAIVDKLSTLGRDIVEIETIQDTVEECLFEQQRFRTAKAYILYRIEKSSVEVENRKFYFSLCHSLVHLNFNFAS